MNTKMTAFAFAGMCGGFGASGLYSRRLRLLLRHHRRERQRTDAAEAVGQKLAAIAGITNMFWHG